MARCQNCRKKSKTLKKVRSTLLINGQARMCAQCRVEFVEFVKDYEQREEATNSRFAGIDPDCERNW